MLEQSDSPSEQDGHQVDVYLVKQSGSYALLRDTSGAYSDVLVLCDRSCLLDGALDTVRNEGERRSFVDPFSGDRVGDNEGRYALGGSATPTICDVERPPPRHERPHRSVRLPKKLGALRRDLEYHLGTRQFVVGVAAGVPLKEPFPTLAKGPFGPVVRPGDEAIQRHRQPCRDFPHVHAPSFRVVFYLKNPARYPARPPAAR